MKSSKRCLLAHVPPNNPPQDQALVAHMGLTYATKTHSSCNSKQSKEEVAKLDFRPSKHKAATKLQNDAVVVQDATQAPETLNTNHLQNQTIEHKPNTRTFDL